MKSANQGCYVKMFEARASELQNVAPQNVESHLHKLTYCRIVAQGCQIFLATTHQNGKKTNNQHKYQMAVEPSK
jgi:hypothetical protein